MMNMTTYEATMMENATGMATQITRRKAMIVPTPKSNNIILMAYVWWAMRKQASHRPHQPTVAP